MSIRTTLLVTLIVVVAQSVAARAVAQVQTPSTPIAETAELGLSGDHPVLRTLLTSGSDLLEREDPVRALETFRLALGYAAKDVDVRAGLGRCHLLLGAPETALRYARGVVDEAPDHVLASELEIRALMRAREFRVALERSQDAVLRFDAAPRAPVLAAHASALFRTQDNQRAEVVYRRVLAIDPLHPEAHLRLGSGLTTPRRVHIDSRYDVGVLAARERRYADAIRHFRRLLDDDPGNPVLHRLLGEALYNRVAADSMASNSPDYRWLMACMPAPDLTDVPVEKFMPSFAQLDPARQAVAARSLALFGSRISRLVAMGGRHDLIGETERTTDDLSRATLRGRRTFDGRVWDDVRGVGGLRAATGIEAIDEALYHGFDTLAHELAHQAHLYAFSQRIRVEIRALYDRAVEAGRCLDFYAASNDAEYFGQGVEAFASLGKRPGYEVTHGHTRFELARVDPALYSLIARLVDYDPLDPARVSDAARSELLRAAIAVALRSGRYDDAVTAADWLPDSVEADVLRDAARRARAEAVGD